MSESYARDLAEARAATSRDEAVLTGEGRICGRRVAVVVCEFGFLGGSIGVAAAERITAAVERATAERLPLLPARGEKLVGGAVEGLLHRVHGAIPENFDGRTIAQARPSYRRHTPAVLLCCNDKKREE